MAHKALHVLAPRVAIVLPALLALVGCAGTAKTAIEKTDFAIAVDCLWGESASRRLCLVGKFRANTRATLLQSQPRSACSLRTTSRVVTPPVSGAQLTELDGSCEPFTEFAVAVLRKPVNDYEQLALEEVVDSAVVAETAERVRHSEALRALRTKAQGLIPGDLHEVEGVAPRLFHVALPEVGIRIASFDSLRESADVSGPRVLILEDRLYPLTGWCSYRTLNVFRLDGAHYIQSGSYCCNCGITLMELFLVTPGGPVEVVSEGRLSD